MNINLPYNTEAEKAVLGAMIANKNICSEGLSVLTAEDFYHENKNHRAIFTAIDNLVNQAIEVDITTLTEELLNNMKSLDTAGGPEYMTDLTETYIGEKNAMNHLNIVRDLALARRFLLTMNQITEEMTQSEIKDISSFIAEGEKRILEVTKSRRVGAFRKTSEVVNKVTENLKMNAGKKKLNGVTSGYSTLDKLTMGWQKGSLIILAARPSVGKTAFSISLAYKAALIDKCSVAFFSLEMSAESIVTRMLSSLEGIDSRNLQLGSLTDEEWVKLDESIRKLKRCNIYIDDTSAAKFNDIRTKAQKLKAQDDSLGLIIVDYLGLITTNNSKVDNRQLEVGEISRSLKALARELDVPIICLCQLSRASEKRTDRTPILSDLRDSGSIEQDADQVLFIYRPNYQNPQAQKESEEKRKAMIEAHNPFAYAEETRIVVAKNRNGATGTMTLSFLMNNGQFIEVDTNDRSEPQ